MKGFTDRFLPTAGLNSFGGEHKIIFKTTLQGAKGIRWVYFVNNSVVAGDGKGEFLFS